MNSALSLAFIVELFSTLKYVFIIHGGPFLLCACLSHILLQNTYVLQQNNYNDNVAVAGTVAEEGEGLSLAGGVDVVVGGDKGGEGGGGGNRLASSYKMIKNQILVALKRAWYSDDNNVGPSLQPHEPHVHLFQACRQTY